MDKPLHFLIVEDNESDVALIVRYLKKTVFDFTFVVVDALQALDNALKENIWDLLICDFTLPGFNAIQVLKQMQAARIDIPFIVVSGTVGEEAAVEIMKAGAHDYIMKDNLTRLGPVIHRELVEAEIRREHRCAEERILKQSHLLDLIGQSVISVDRQQNITFWNKASEALYGWTAEEAIGKNLKTIMVHHNQTLTYSDISTCIINGVSWSREFDVIKRDGTYVPAHVTHTPILDEKGELIEIIGISFDITERRKTEEAMIRKIEELAASNKELRRINRLTIGREMRMIELKHHCNALAVKLGIEKPYPMSFLNETDYQTE